MEEERKSIWGWLLLIAGCIILLNIILAAAIPVLRFLLAILLIYWGYKFLQKKRSGKSELFGNYSYTSPFTNNYNIVLGTAVFDFSNHDLSQHNIEINITLSRVKIILPATLPIKIETQTFAGKTSVQKDSIYFGSYNYEQNQLPGRTSNLHLQITNILGEVMIEKI